MNKLWCDDHLYNQYIDKFRQRTIEFQVPFSYYCNLIYWVTLTVNGRGYEHFQWDWVRLINGKYKFGSIRFDRSFVDCSNMRFISIMKAVLIVFCCFALCGPLRFVASASDIPSKSEASDKIDRNTNIIDRSYRTPLDHFTPTDSRRVEFVRSECCCKFNGFLKNRYSLFYVELPVKPWVLSTRWSNFHLYQWRCGYSLDHVRLGLWSGKRDASWLGDIKQSIFRTKYISVSESCTCTYVHY